MSKSTKQFMLIIKHNGLTVDRLAKQFGISRTQVQKSIENFCSLSHKKQMAISRKLHTSPDVLCRISSGEITFLDYLQTNKAHADTHC